MPRRTTDYTIETLQRITMRWFPAIEQLSVSTQQWKVLVDYLNIHQTLSLNRNNLLLIIETIAHIPNLSHQLSKKNPIRSALS